MRRRSPIRPWMAAVGVCAGIATVPGCTDRAPDRVAAVVIDSAGIPIKLSPDLGVTYARVVPEPLVSLGGPGAEGATQFFQVTNVQLDPDDRLWVSDWQAGELRVFEADGSHAFTRGRRGEGPGEFTAIRLLGMYAEDTVVVADGANGSMTIYDRNGALIRSERLNSGDEVFPRPFAVFSDGSILGQVPVQYRSDDVDPGATLRTSVRIRRFFTDREPLPIVETFSGPSWIWNGRALIPIPFTANAAFDLRSDTLHLAMGPAFRVGVYEGDRVVRMYGVDRDARTVTSRDIDEYREIVREVYPEDLHEGLLAALDHPERPIVSPAYTRLLIADDGAVWAGSPSSDVAWDVFGEAGELLGQVAMPLDFYAMSIRGGRIAGVWRDDLQVEYVRVYQLMR